jgi:hypothetical protein
MGAAPTTLLVGVVIIEELPDGPGDDCDSRWPYSSKDLLKDVLGFGLVNGMLLPLALLVDGRSLPRLVEACGKWYSIPGITVKTVLNDEGRDGLPCSNGG